MHEEFRISSKCHIRMVIICLRLLYFICEIIFGGLFCCSKLSKIILILGTLWQEFMLSKQSLLNMSDFALIHGLRLQPSSSFLKTGYPISQIKIYSTRIAGRYAPPLFQLLQMTPLEKCHSNCITGIPDRLTNVF